MNELEKEKRLTLIQDNAKKWISEIKTQMLNEITGGRNKQSFVCYQTNQFKILNQILINRS